MERKSRSLMLIYFGFIKMAFNLSFQIHHIAEGKYRFVTGLAKPKWMLYSLSMFKVGFFKSVFLFGLFSASTSFANPADYLKCYNEFRFPAKPVNVFGVPIIESREIDLPSHVSRFTEPLSTTAYIVTSKTILKKTFNYSTAQDIGTERNPSGGGLVRVLASPIFEVDSLYTGTLAKVFVSAKWSVTLDHPNGASLSIAEEPHYKMNKNKRSVSKEPAIGNPHLTSESRIQVINYLKDQIENAIQFKKGAAKAYDVCTSIPELRDFMRSKTSFFETNTNPKAPAPVKPASGRAR